jgi:hypothetical protein
MRKKMPENNFPKLVYCQQENQTFHFTLRGIERYFDMIRWLNTNCKDGFTCKFDIEVDDQWCGTIRLYEEKDAMLFKMTFDTGKEFNWKNGE